MKKLFSILICFVLIFTTIIVQTSCGRVVEITSAEQLTGTNIFGDVKLVLMNDIDLEFEKITPITCKEFDGQNFTIRNCMINTQSYTESGALFGNVESIKNLKLENIEVNAGASESAAVVCAGGSKKIENVHVENSTATCVQANKKGIQDAYLGIIYGGSLYESGNSWYNFSEKLDCEIIDCTVKNCSVKIEYSEYDTSYVGDIYVGGIAGASNSIKNCSVENTKIFAESSGLYGVPYAGGIVGFTNGNIECNYVKNCEITCKSRLYFENLLGYSGAKDCSLGGIVGWARGESQVKYCYAMANKLIGNTTEQMFAGAIAGKIGGSINQCYSQENNFELKLSIPLEPEYFVVGGIAGLSGGTIYSSFSYENSMNISKDGESKGIKIGGILGMIEGGLVYSCASINNELGETGCDIFCPSKSDDISDCYVTVSEYPNVNECEVVADSFWKSEQEIKNKLLLLSSYWQFRSGAIPYLSFN